MISTALHWSSSCTVFKKKQNKQKPNQVNLSKFSKTEQRQDEEQWISTLYSLSVAPLGFFSRKVADPLKLIQSPSGHVMDTLCCHLFSAQYAVVCICAFLQFSEMNVHVCTVAVKFRNSTQCEKQLPCTHYAHNWQPHTDDFTLQIDREEKLIICNYCNNNEILSKQLRKLKYHHAYMNIKYITK